MNRVLVIGAAGMIGRKLTARLLKEGVGELIQQDVVPFEGTVSDLSAPGEAEKLIAKRPDLIFHLAAVVSGELPPHVEAEREDRDRPRLEAQAERARKPG